MLTFRPHFADNSDMLAPHGTFAPRQAFIQRGFFALMALALLVCGCTSKPPTIAGTWHIVEIPNDTWTFGSEGRFSVIADNAPYDKGSYELTTQTARQDPTAQTGQVLRIHMASENTPPYAITWIDPNRFCLSADHVELTLYR